MAKEVTLDELRVWLNKNQHRTWRHSFSAGGPPRTFEVKYLKFHLDTRDGKIFHLSGRGLGNQFEVDFRDDEKDWTILDLLESKLDEAKQ